LHISSSYYGHTLINAAMGIDELLH
jgi:hypothetical protein